MPDDIRVITNADGHGWLTVEYEKQILGAPDKRYPPLPQYLRVKFQERRQERDWFTVLEGLDRIRS